MVSGGTVNSDASNLSNIMSKYTSSIEGITGSWTGTSHDSFESMTSEFSSSFPETINSQLTAFASACDDYINYEKMKNSLKQMEEQKASMAASGEGSGMATINNEIATMKQDINSLKSKIESSLSEAGSTKLEATALSASVAASVGGTASSSTTETTATGDKDPNLTYSAKYDNYVFPFANGVSAPVTSSLGLRDAPTAGASSDHHGTDIGVEYGTEIHAIQGGIVEEAGRENAGGFGNWVVIRQDDGNRTIYGHVSESGYYNVGDRVETGAVIANVGSEGVSTGPHLHLQIEDSNGGLIDSEDIFEGVWPT